MSTLSHLVSCPFLIIGGTSKAGTTSVFNYLANHPSISATPAKETRFFLDGEYPLPSTKRYEADGIAAYQTFYRDVPHGRNQYMLEATPDYLYSAGTAASIRQALENVRLIFLLREPFSRLLSFYRFGQNMNEIPRSMSFDHFVRLQREDEGSTGEKIVSHPAFLALQHGRYSNYLPPFLNSFGRSAIHIAFYEELRHDPRRMMSSLCRWIGINEAFYRDYSFEVVNRGAKVRSPRINQAFFQFKKSARALVRGYPRIRAAMRTVGHKVNKAHQKVNTGRAEETSMSEEVRQFLYTYYRDEALHLKKLLGIEIPWAERSEAAVVK